MKLTHTKYNDTNKKNKSKENTIRLRNYSGSKIKS